MDGIFNIYKEKGFTSHDVVAIVRRTIHMKKVGHTGTLDPDAEGVLPVCVGKATKLSDVIMDGRDIGTVVLPDADLKIFLTASPEERASRRYLELQEKPDAPTYEQILQDIKKRDYQDTHREIAPLRQAEDAVLIDTTNMGFHEVCDALLELMEERLDLE